MLTRTLIERIIRQLEQIIMSAKSASKRMATTVVAKSVRANGAKPRAKKVRMSKLEAKRLESFKALMLKFGGKGQFAGYDG